MLWALLGALAGAGVVAQVMGFVDRRRAEGEYAARVRLGLDGLVALLPTNLRHLRYTRFWVQHTHERGVLYVGLAYEVPHVHRGVPHVGLVFDVRSGALLRVEPNGFRDPSSQGFS